MVIGTLQMPQNHTSRSDQGTDPDLSALYPQFTPDELQGVRENLDAYIEHALLMYERIREDPKAYEEFRLLTGRNDTAMMTPIEPLRNFPDQPI
jgi:hypothetical protein